MRAGSAEFVPARKSPPRRRVWVDSKAAAPEDPSMPLPAPRDQLAGCIWLPRITAKARLFQSGQLPPEYAARFGVRDGVDEVFLRYFGIDRQTLIAASGGTDAQVAAWFLALPGATPERIGDWNHIAVNLGRPGFPLEARFPVGLATTYAHLAPLKPDSIFAMLEADEGIRPGP
jgi:hypothetical protein